MNDKERAKRLRFLANKIVNDVDLNKLCGHSITTSISKLLLDVADRLEVLSNEQSNSIRSNGSTEAQDRILFPSSRS